MKILIVSDIHGSLDAAHGIVALAASYDMVFCLGDVLYHGPRNDLPRSYAPKSVIPLMNSLSDRILAVRGNCEAEVDQMVLSFPVMSTTAMAMVDGRRMVLSHGHIFNEDSLPPAADIFLYGHTHIPVAHRKDGVICFNPGSAGIPKGRFPASYGEYIDGVLNVRSLDDDEVLMSIDIRS